MRTVLTIFMIAGSAMLASCRNGDESEQNIPRDGRATFIQDILFLEKHTPVQVITDRESGAKVALAPAWQGRVMTSTTGKKNASYGWINYKAVEAGIRPEGERTGLARHIHVFGGEERLWLGPEGGQFALFFPKDVPYDLEHWKTPALLDTEPFKIVGRSESSIRFARKATLTNRAGTVFHLRIARAVKMLDKGAIARLLKVPVANGLPVVGYRSTNEIENIGNKPWTREGGLISIWMLGMFKYGPGVTVVVPLAEGPGAPVRSDYFGAPDKDRLKVADKAVFFKADGQFRTKIGIPPGRSTGVAGSWDPERSVLTIIRCDRPANATELAWVRSQWKDHENPYDGEQIHVYNDGPPEPGAPPLGPFYEIETSSPAMPLQSGAKMVHVVDTIHLDAPKDVLNPIAQIVLGVSLDEIEKVFK
jgi:hypothetical protein